MQGDAEESSARDRPRTEARYRKLKPRPGRAGEEVAGHQRARLHAATIELVDEHGYEALTVTGIARAAGVSNRTFYENFEDKEDCFCATYDLIVRHTVREILAARLLERGSRAKLEAGFQAFVREVAERPQAARLALVEAFASRSTMERMRHTNGLFEELVTETFAKDAVHGVELPPLVTKGVVAGVTRIARARILAGEEERLAENVDELIRWTLSLCDENAGSVCPGSVRATPQQPPSLSAGGHRARDIDQIPGDERAMILSVTTRLAAGEGYGALSVPRIRAAAGVSRRCFEEHFADIADCFLAALEALAGRVLTKAASAYLSADSWLGGVHRALATICREIAEDPILVRLAFFELYAPAGKAVGWRTAFIADLGAWLRHRAPTFQCPSPLATEASIGAGWAVLHHYATTGRASQLPKVAGTASYLILAPAVGAEAAANAITAEQHLTSTQSAKGMWADAAPQASRAAANRYRDV